MTSNNIETIYSTIFFTEKSIMDYVLEDIVFNVDYWKSNHQAKLPQGMNISFKLSKNDSNGETYILFEIIRKSVFKEDNNQDLLNILNSVFENIILKIRTTESFAIMVNKIPTDELRKKNSFDFFRLAEEIGFSIEKILNHVIKKINFSACKCW